MNKHLSGVDIVDENDTTMNRSDVNSDRFVDNVPVGLPAYDSLCDL